MRYKKLSLLVLSSLLVFGGTIYAADSINKKEREVEPLPLIELDNVPVGAKEQLNFASNINIKEKMLNSIDYFTNASGIYSVVIDHIQVNETIEFEVEQSPVKKSKVTTINHNTEEVSHHKFEEEKIQIFDENYLVDEVNTDQISIGKPIGERHLTTSSGENIYVYRNDPAFSGPAQDYLLPQAYAFWLNDDTNNYEIIGTEKYLEREVTIIKGIHEPDMAEKHNAINFELWVDNNSGILLKLIEKNENGEVTNLIQAEEIFIQ